MDVEIVPAEWRDRQVLLYRRWDPMTVATTSLGISGYTFADLHEPERLASLYERFCEGVSAADPAAMSR